MTVDAAILTQLATGSWKMIWLVEVGFSTPLRLTDAEHDVVYGGNTYTSWPAIHVTAPRQDMGGGVTVTLSDDGTIDARERTGDAAGRTLTVTRLYSTADGLKTISEWSGVIENYDSENYGKCVFRADAPHLIRVGPAMPVWCDTCINDFKSAQCGYAGVTTSCDGTISACEDMAGGSNRVNFISAFKAPTPGDIVVLGGQRYVVGGYQPAPVVDPPGQGPPWNPTAAPHNQPVTPLHTE